MSYSLENWCVDAKRILKEKSGNDARAAVAERLKNLLVDPGFVSTYFDEQKGEPQKIIYRDPELGFLMMVHHHKPGRKGPPHDHGESWAIYGVSKGCTEMTEWRRQDDGSKPNYAVIEPDRIYRLDAPPRLPRDGVCCG